MHQRGSAGRDIGRCCLGAAVFLTSFQLTGEGPVSLPSPSASLYNPARIVAPPSGFVPTVPKGFRVSVFASGFEEPRWLAVAPNGDVFVSDSAAGRIVVLPDPSRQTPAKTRDVFAEHLSLPFGIAFRGDFIYVAEQNAVDRFRFDRRTSRRLGEKEQLIGYAVVFVPFRGGNPTAGAELFASGWVPDPAQAEAYGRPVGVAVAKDGSLLVSDDGAKVIWRVFYQP